MQNGGAIFGQFGDIQFDQETLTRKGRRVAIGPKPIALLRSLYARRGNFVLYKDLIWETYRLRVPDVKACVDIPKLHSLQMHKRALCKVIGDKWIETDYGRGYRLRTDEQLLQIKGGVALSPIAPVAPIRVPASSVPDNLSAQFLADARIAAQIAVSVGSRAIYLEDVYVHRVKAESVVLDSARKYLSAADTDRAGEWLSIIGEAGHGKTSLLWFLANELRRECERVISIQALHTDQASLDELVRSIPRSKGAFFVLIDTLDLLCGVDDPSLSARLNAIRAAGGFLITTCRRQEIQTLETFIRCDRTVPLGRFEPEEAESAVKRYIDASYPGWREGRRVVQALNIGQLLDAQRRVQELTFEPLVLRMIFETYVPERIPSDINTQQVYNRYWEQRVAGDRTARSLEAAAARTNLLKAMVSHIYFGSGAHNERMTLDALVQIAKGGGQRDSYSLIEGLVSSGVLHWRQMKVSLGFFHQTFAEYAAAKALLENPNKDIRKRWIELLLADLEQVNLFRLPVLKQLMIQASRVDAQLFHLLCGSISEVDTPVAARLTLEVLGKVSEVHSLDQIVLAWCARSPDLFRGVSNDVVRHYPAKRIELALRILEEVIDVSNGGEVCSVCESYFAPMEPQKILEFLVHLWNDKRALFTSREGSLKGALVATFKCGDTAALASLADILPNMSPGVQAGAIIDLGEAWAADAREQTKSFLRRMVEHSARVKENEVRIALAHAFSTYCDIDPSATRSLAIDFARRVSDSEDLKARMFSARLLGIATADAERIDAATRDVLTGTHIDRLCGSEFLREAAGRRPEIIDRLLALKSDESSSHEIVNAIYFIASGIRDPARMLAVLHRWPPTGTGSGDAYRSLIANAAIVGPERTLAWLRGQMADANSPSRRRLILAGFQVLAEQAVSSLSGSDFREFFEWGFEDRRSSDECRRVFSSAAGLAAEVDPAVAERIFRRIFGTHRKEFINAAINSLQRVSSPTFIGLAFDLTVDFTKRQRNYASFGHFLGVMTQRNPEIRAAVLQKLADPSFEPILKAIDSPVAVSNLFKVLKSSVRAELVSVLRVIGVCPLLDDGNAASLSAVLENACREIEEPSVARSILRQLLDLSASPSYTVRNALVRALPKIDSLLPHREVVRAVMEKLQTETAWDSEAVEQLIWGVRRLPSLTRDDKEILLRANLPPRAKSLLLD